MSNFVFYDFETSSSNKQWGQIIEIGAILADEQLNELDRFESRSRLSPGIIPEAMSLIVTNTSPKKLKTTNLSHYEMIKQFVDKLKSRGYKSLKIHCHNMPHESHSSVPPGGLSRGLRYIFDHWDPNQ